MRVFQTAVRRHLYLYQLALYQLPLLTRALACAAALHAPPIRFACPTNPLCMPHQSATNPQSCCKTTAGHVILRGCSRPLVPSAWSCLPCFAVSFSARLALPCHSLPALLCLGPLCLPCRVCRPCECAPTATSLPWVQAPGYARECSNLCALPSWSTLFLADSPS